MKLHIYLLSVLLLVACGTSSTDNSNSAANSNKTDTLTTLDTKDSLGLSDMATYFVVVADTSREYYYLQKKMAGLAPQLNLPIDTMDRYYNKEKDLIVLHDDATDEIYAGDYFPRIFPAESLSLEYLDFYKGLHIGKTIALVTGIYENESSADSALAILKKIEPSGFKMKTEICMGCMH